MKETNLGDVNLDKELQIQKLGQDYMQGFQIGNKIKKNYGNFILISKNLFETVF